MLYCNSNVDGKHVYKVIVLRCNFYLGTNDLKLSACSAFNIVWLE